MTFHTFRDFSEGRSGVEETHEEEEEEDEDEDEDVVHPQVQLIFRMDYARCLQ